MNAIILVNTIQRLAVLIAGISTLSGCATAMVSSMPVTNTQYVKNYVLEDEVIAVAVAKENTATSKQGDLVLIGNSNSYHLVQGNKEIQTLMELDASAIKINNEQAIELELKEDKFNGYIQVRYIKSTYSDEEKNRLTLDGFRISSMATGINPYYAKSIAVRGTVYAKVENVPQTAISKGRKIKFYTQKRENSLDVNRAVMRVIELPMAIMFDVVTAPIQGILLIGAIAATSPAKH